MTQTLLVVKALVAVAIATSVAFAQQSELVAPTDPVPLSQQVQVAPKVVAKQATKAKKNIKRQVSGDCEKYATIIKSYDWPVDVAMNICKYESQGDPEAVGDGNTEYVSCGLFQIRTIEGRPSCGDLKDPQTNVKYAYYLWQNEGFRPWSVCRNLVDCD